MNKRFSLLALGLDFFLIAPSALVPDPYRTKINRYVCDHQLVKKGNQIEERRVIIKGKGVQRLREKRYWTKNDFPSSSPFLPRIRFSIKTTSPFFTRRER